MKFLKDIFNKTVLVFVKSAIGTGFQMIKLVCLLVGYLIVFLATFVFGLLNGALGSVLMLLLVWTYLGYEMPSF